MTPWITALVALALIGGQLHSRSTQPARPMADWSQQVVENLLVLARQDLALGLQIVARPQDQAGAVLVRDRLQAPPALERGRLLRLTVYEWDKSKKRWISSRKTLRDAALTQVRMFTLDSRDPVEVFALSRPQLDPFLDLAVADLPLGSLAMKGNRNTFRVEIHGRSKGLPSHFGSFYAKRKGLLNRDSR
ncbi:MAG: hypothetical protein GKR89_28290 [Candidatus Latescibacteria bacterium]|nr:hypothetical protein [Candidatus Latescibacterota bacterium]